MSREREIRIEERIGEAHLLTPTRVAIAQHAGVGVAVAFEIDGITETVEVCGTSDEEAADVVVRQLRQRLMRGE